jgi:hypothetical protein
MPGPHSTLERGWVSAIGEVIANLTPILDRLRAADAGVVAAGSAVDGAQDLAVAVGAAGVIDGLAVVRDRVDDLRRALLATIATADDALHRVQGLAADTAAVAQGSTVPLPTAVTSRTPDRSRPPVIGPGQVPADAAPFNPQVAAVVPSYGNKGDKTTGVLELSDGRVLPPQDSGYDGPALRMPKPRPGMDRTLVTHVEAHAVAAMREYGATSGTLYINRAPCEFPHPASGRPWGCENALERMLRPEETMTIYAPDGYVRVFTGRPSSGPAEAEGR